MLGHSMGGQIISAASELAPERFTRLVYLSAFLPADGDSIVSMSRHNAGSELSRATHVSLIRGRLSILGTAAGPVFYGDCAPEMIAQATGRLAPESLRPSFQRISLSRERFGRVPRSYIRLTEDRAITPAFQDWMLSRQPCERVQSLESSHSPFLSMPAALASAIRSVVDGSPT
jgi:pimeloyl-ACP methyl ester carboxylesterase